MPYASVLCELRSSPSVVSLSTCVWRLTMSALYTAADADIFYISTSVMHFVRSSPKPSPKLGAKQFVHLFLADEFLRISLLNIVGPRLLVSSVLRPGPNEERLSEKNIISKSRTREQVSFIGQFSKTSKIPIPPLSFFKKKKLNFITECGLTRAKNINWARHAHKTAVALSSPRARAACDVGPRFSIIFSDNAGCR